MALAKRYVRKAASVNVRLELLRPSRHVGGARLRQLAEVEPPVEIGEGHGLQQTACIGVGRC